MWQGSIDVGFASAQTYPLAILPIPVALPAPVPGSSTSTTMTVTPTPNGGFQKNMPGVRFYTRRGFHRVELSDGSGNEELEPDALYQWRR